MRLSTQSRSSLAYNTKKASLCLIFGGLVTLTIQIPSWVPNKWEYLLPAWLTVAAITHIATTLALRLGHRHL